MTSIRTAAASSAVSLALALASFGVPAQPGDTTGPLTVVKCSAAANSCDAAQDQAALPSLGAAGRATVVSRNLRSTEVALEPTDYDVLIPGCTPSGPGVFECGTPHEFQHCRTLMFSSMVHSCRAGNPFAGDFAEPRESQAGEYLLSVKSNARVRVTRGDRGFGQMRGSARVELAIDQPDVSPGAWCVQRNTMLFAATGPDGGVAEIDEAEPCEEPIEFSFKPNEDDVLRAYANCDAFAAWGDKIEDSMDILAAGLFQFRSANPDFASRYEGGTAIIAPWVTVEARLEIDCSY
jgi:hypothetical protein